jgi:hypothetical protein
VKKVQTHRAWSAAAVMKVAPFQAAVGIEHVATHQINDQRAVQIDWHGAGHVRVLDFLVGAADVVVLQLQF